MSIFEFPKRMSLISSSIVDIINAELDQAKRGALIRLRLTSPYKKDFLVIRGSIETRWVVFDERPRDPVNGYLIVVNEDTRQFGIATKNSSLSKDVGFLFGVYPSFMEAYKSL